MMHCSGIREVLHEYLDGRLNGVEMQQVASHLEDCASCGIEARQLVEMQMMLAELGRRRFRWSCCRAFKWL